MSKTISEKINFTTSFEIWQKRAMERISLQKGLPLNEIIIESLQKDYPEQFETAKKSYIRTIVSSR
jgi:hypothetical protein